MNLADRIKQAWSKETAFLPDEWSDENPARGQCAVTAAVVQDELDGEIVKCEVSGESYKHFYNRLLDGTIVDLTREQFNSDVVFENEMVADREKILSHPGTLKRYEILRNNLLNKTTG